MRASRTCTDRQSLAAPKNRYAGATSGNLHHVKDANESGEREEPGIRLQQHPLDFVDLRCSTAVLLRFVEPVRHRREHLELEE